MEQVLSGQAGEQPVGQAIGGAQIVVESGVNPGLEVFPAPVSVDVGRPGYGKRMHAVLVLQKVSGVKAVLAAAARYQAVVAAVGLAVLVAQLPQLAFPVGPVDLAFLVVAGMAGVAYAVLLNNHGLLCGMNGVLKLIAAVGFLVAHYTLTAELHVLGQAIKGFALLRCKVGCVIFVMNRQMPGKFLHKMSLSFYDLKAKAPAQSPGKNLLKHSCRRLCLFGVFIINCEMEKAVIKGLRLPVFA